MNENHFRIGRIVTCGARIEYFEPCVRFGAAAIEAACRHFWGRLHVLQTPGGFLFDLLNFEGARPGQDSAESDYEEIVRIAEKTAEDYLLSKPIRKILREKTDFLTLGVDIWSEQEDDPRHAELVGTYDTGAEKFIYWTGKSYPTGMQQNTLIYCVNLESHLQHLNGRRALVLGCHDLNMFSPRSRASLGADTFKAQTIEKMQSLCEKFRPEIVLQHPHMTDSPNIWALPWLGVRECLPSVRTYASGIHYGNLRGGAPRQSLESVLRKTAQGEVENFVLQTSA